MLNPFICTTANCIGQCIYMYIAVFTYLLMFFSIYRDSCIIVVKSMNSGARIHTFQPWLCYMLDM